MDYPQQRHKLVIIYIVKWSHTGPHKLTEPSKLVVCASVVGTLLLPINSPMIQLKPAVAENAFQ